MEAAAPLCSPMVIQVCCLFSETDLQHKQPGGGELVPTQGVYNATTRIVTVSQANHCIEVYSVLPLKDK